MHLTVGQYTVHQWHEVNWYPTLKAHLREVCTIHIVFLLEVGFRPSPTGERKPIKNFYVSKRGSFFHNFVLELTSKSIYFIVQFFYRKFNCRFMVSLYVKQNGELHLCRVTLILNVKLTPCLMSSRCSHEQFKE